MSLPAEAVLKKRYATLPRDGQELFIFDYSKAKKILRDAYLQCYRHLRPGLPEGLPFWRQKKQALALEIQILTLFLVRDN